MEARTRRLLVGLAGWTLFVWLTRVRNVVGDDDLGTAVRLGGLALAGSFVVLAALVLAGLREPAARLRRRVGLLAGWTTAVWLVRGVAIATGGHAAGFVAVHLVLAVVSIALAAVSWRAVGGGLPTASGSARLGWGR
jgi:hypothetical protein